MAGYRNVDELYSTGSDGYYWSSSLCTSYSYNDYYLAFVSGCVSWYNSQDIRYDGQSVRPVLCVMMEQQQ